MISVENFYWMLYENVLKPHALDCWYYYPWGTKKHLSRAGEFRRYDRKTDANHALFHFDQEPLWEDSLGWLYECGQRPAWAGKLIRILANSEHSQTTKRIIADRGMLDWYFFYHGFAALDWYRDTRYVDPPGEITSAFLSFNHITQAHRSYRLDLISRLLQIDICDKGKVSLHASVPDIERELQDPYSLLSATSKQRIHDTLCNNTRLPWVIDDVTINSNLSARCGHREFALWQSALLHVVNETVFYADKLHLTEKIFKPIVAKRPFVLAAAPGNLAYFRSYGFQTFASWIDESYDDMQDPDQRLSAITGEIAKISSLSPGQMRDLVHDMQKVLDHNKRHFFTDFRAVIVQELVDNFETCLRIWNNGRVDGREISCRINTDSVKNILLS